MGAPRGMHAWRTRQFEYTWLRTLSRRYADFWQVTQEALVVSAQATGLDLTVKTREHLMRTRYRNGRHSAFQPTRP